jgi:hypothetical protein
MSTLTFDAGALIALEHNNRRVLSLVAIALEERARIVIPATALAQVIREPAKQARLSRFIHLETTDIVPLDARYANRVGKCCLQGPGLLTSLMPMWSFARKRQVPLS